MRLFFAACLGCSFLVQPALAQDTGDTGVEDTGESSDVPSEATPASDLAGENGGTDWPSCSHVPVGHVAWLAIPALALARRRS